jgi:hypothetical protein
MKRITHLSLALIMFSLFSISYLITTVTAQSGPSATPGTGPTAFDDTLMGAPGMSGAAITGSDSVICGGLPGKLLETNCLRDVLDASNHAVKKAKGQKRGNYGCGNSDRFKHTACLRAILHSSDNTFAPGTN